LDGLHLLDIFQGIATLMAAESKLFWGRIGLMVLGLLLMIRSIF